MTSQPSTFAITRSALAGIAIAPDAAAANTKSRIRPNPFIAERFKAPIVSSSG